MKIQTKDLKLAQIRYFDAERKAVEVPRDKAYVFLLKRGDQFINVFNPALDLPVYQRTLYSRTYYDGVNPDGEDYGTLIELASGEVKEGPCYVLENFHDDKIFDEETITMRQLENCVINSDNFFIDRADVIREVMSEYDKGEGVRRKAQRFLQRKQIDSLSQKYLEALEKKARFEEYLEGCAKEQNTK